MDPPCRTVEYPFDNKFEFDSKTKRPKQPNQTRAGATKKCGRELAELITGNKSKFFKGTWDQSGFWGAIRHFF